MAVLCDRPSKENEKTGDKLGPGRGLTARNVTQTKTSPTYFLSFTLKFHRTPFSVAICHKALVIRMQEKRRFIRQGFFLNGVFE